ncbi:O-antigen ligase family protein [Roseibium sp.]|uniref:O-antigen ligase family protein n=1 Tax=Roseibium sp. TaxID=1936156 RepID=UPI003B503A63
MTSIPIFDIALVNYPDGWTGFARGLEISVIDYLAVIAFLVLPWQRVSLLWFLPFVLFTIIAMVAATEAAKPLTAFFGVWQFAKTAFIALVVARACAVSEVPYLVLRGMALAMAAQLTASLWQRFGVGDTQASGLFSHQNTLGMIAHFVLYPFLFMLLTQGRGTVWNGLVILWILCCVMLTASRGAVGFTAIGIGLTFVIVALAGLTNRIMATAALAAMTALALAPATYLVFEKRFERAALNEDVYDERAAFNRAADLIRDDFPAGVGFNHYTYTLKRYNYSQLAGVHQNEGNINNIVHDVYRLIGVETGRAGLLSFYALLAVPLVTAFFVGWRRRLMPDGGLLLGFGTAMLIAYLHSLFEWIFLIKEVQIVFAIVVGMTFGIASRPYATEPSSHQRIESENTNGAFTFKAGALSK